MSIVNGHFCPFEERNSLLTFQKNAYPKGELLIFHIRKYICESVNINQNCQTYPLHTTFFVPAKKGTSPVSSCIITTKFRLSDVFQSQSQLLLNECCLKFLFSMKPFDGKLNQGINKFCI